MKEFAFLILGVGMVMLIALGLMRGSATIENSAGNGTIDQQTLSDSLRETIAPTEDIVPTGDPTPEGGDATDAPLAPGDVAD